MGIRIVIPRSLSRVIAFAIPLCLFIISSSPNLIASVLPAKRLSDPVVKIAIPYLTTNVNCTGSGQKGGLHPGWSSRPAIKLTATKIHNKVYRISWCPATAPSGFGVISYTVTAQLGGLTCESTKMSCDLVGINDGTPLRIMATDQSGSYLKDQSAIQNSGVVTFCGIGDVGCIAGAPQSSFATYSGDRVQTNPICTFAAVANWETVILGAQPDPAHIESEFIQAGGFPSGLSNAETFAYWTKHGIGGAHLESATPLFQDPATLLRTIRSPDIKAVIAQLHFKSGANFAGYVIAKETFHWVVIDGFTPTGPIAISWGQRLQMTWEQWNVEAIAMWSIATR